jgi:hypothetical protein
MVPADKDQSCQLYKEESTDNSHTLHQSTDSNKLDFTMKLNKTFTTNHHLK